MLRTKSSLALLVCFALSAVLVNAQDEKKQTQKKKTQKRGVTRIQVGGRGGFGGQTTLVAHPKVQEDLKLTDKQKKELSEAVKKVNAASRLNLQGLSREEVRDKIRELTEARKESNEKLAQLIKKTLNKEQAVRLEQIKLQTRGTQALFDKKIADKLKVTEEQRKKMISARREISKERRELGEQLRSKDITARDYFEQSQELQKTSDKEVTAVLTKEQQEAFKKMKGKILKLNRRVGVFGVPSIQIRPGNLKKRPGNFKKRNKKKAAKKGDIL